MSARRAPIRSSAGCARKSPRCRARRSSCSRLQDVNVGGRTSRTQYQYTLQDADLDELSAWAPKMLAAMKKLPQLADVASDQQTNSTQLEVDIDRDQAVALRHPDLADRSDAGRCLRAGAGDAVFHPAQRLSRHPGDPAEAAAGPEHAAASSTSSHRSPARWCRCRRWCSSTPTTPPCCRSITRTSSRA